MSAPTTALDDLMSLLADPTDVASTSEATVEFARRHLRAEAAGLARHDPTGLVLLARSSTAVDTWYTISDVPTPWADLDDASPRAIADTRSDERYPEFSHELAARGVRSFCSVPLGPLRHHLLTLDLFSSEAGAFPADPAAGGADVALRCAALVIACLDRVENLHQALETREVIAQAQGMLMERYRLTGEQAMAYLRRTSQHAQVKVRDLAEELVGDQDAAPGPLAVETHDRGTP